MTDSTPENPYASPAVGLAPSQQASATTNFWPPALVPRWWEWLLYAVLVAVMGPLAWVFLSELDLEGPLLVVSPTLLGQVLHILIFITTFCLGLVLLRLWWWRSLPQGLAPGHTLLLAGWFSTVVSISIFVAVSVYLPIAMADVPNTSWVETISRVNFVSTSVNALVANLGMCAILLGLLPRKSLWFLAACVFLIVASISTLRTFGLLDSIVSGVTYFPWLLVALSFLALAIHEHWRGIRRDWLHWAGIVCWASFLVVGIAGDIWWHLG